MIFFNFFIYAPSIFFVKLMRWFVVYLRPTVFKISLWRWKLWFFFINFPLLVHMYKKCVCDWWHLRKTFSTTIEFYAEQIITISTNFKWVLFSIDFQFMFASFVHKKQVSWKKHFVKVSKSLRCCKMVLVYLFLYACTWKTWAKSLIGLDTPQSFIFHSRIGYWGRSRRALTCRHFPNWERYAKVNE